VSHLQNIPNLPVYRSTLSLNKVIDKINAKNEDETEKRKEIKTVAWIIIIGDSLHNFIDGVSIGAGFVQSFSTGAILSLAIMCEEFPHELGIKMRSMPIWTQFIN
jgi:zinc transporter ZupT